MLKHHNGRFKHWAAIALVLCAASATAQDLATRAQAVIEKIVADEGLPGLTAGIAKDGEIVWLGASGFMDVENKVAAVPDMVHRIASISKAMTATAAMQLVEQGKLKLDEPVRTYAPSWPQKAEGEILIWHLLSHTSGMRHYLSRENRPMEHYATLLDAVALFKDRPLACAPGDRYIYTTYGYTLLGAAMESASGMDYATLMHERIWGPAKMENTSLEIKGGQTANKSKLYRRAADGFVEDVNDDASVRYPGGGIQSTAGDLLRFAIAFDREQLVSRATMDRMQVIPEVRDPGGTRRTPYALGWMVGSGDGFGRFVSHDGGQSGTSTQLSVYLDKHVAVSVLCNLQDAGRPVFDATLALARLAIGLPEAAPTAGAPK